MSLKREHSAWYSQVLLGLASGGGVQHTLSLIPVLKEKEAKLTNLTTSAVLIFKKNLKSQLRTVNHVCLLHVALTAGLTTFPTHSWHVVGDYCNLPSAHDT